ncbi:MAG TPA: helix-turn-helix transcriptional regulator [bacterium]|nr:helix-turn-helix transcriptional regulator [bacterium]
MNVKKARLKMGLTQEALGEKCGLDSRHVGFVERGEINSTIKTIFKISRGLGCSISTLFRKV